MAEVAEPRLEISGLEKSFGGTRALSGVDLSLAPGEVSPTLAQQWAELRRGVIALIDAGRVG